MTSMEQACEARVGQLLKGKWTLERVLGIGGMAAVYVAQHKIGRREAIKILHPEVARDAEQRKRFEQEARAANTLTHPGMVEVRDIDTTEDGCPFMVMEFLEGETMGDMAGRLNGLPLPDLLRFTDEVLDVLAAAHEHGIVHRDIKLGNLFITTEGKVKVLDFGIARLAKSQITRMGARLGTAAYMPPEQVKGEQVDGRADLFAVGATMFRILAKRRVHEAPTESELIVKMASDPAPLLATVCDAPGDVCLVVDRALAYRAADRYPDARLMQADVQALRRGEKPPYAASAAAGGAPERIASTRADVPGGRVVGASSPTANVTVMGAHAAAGPPTRIGPHSSTDPSSTTAQSPAGRRPDAYAPTGYDMAPPSGRVSVVGPPPVDASTLGSAATMMPSMSRQHTPMPGSMGAVVPMTRQETPPPGSMPASSMGGYPMSVPIGAPMSGPMSVVHSSGPQIVVAPVSMGGEAVAAGGATVAAMDVPLPLPPSRGLNPIVLGAIGGGVFLVLAIVLLLAMGGDETAPADASSAAAFPTASTPAPVVTPLLTAPTTRSRTTTPPPRTR